MVQTAALAEVSFIEGRLKGLDLRLKFDISRILRTLEQYPNSRNEAVQMTWALERNVLEYKFQKRNATLPDDKTMASILVVTDSSVEHSHPGETDFGFHFGQFEYFIMHGGKNALRDVVTCIELMRTVFLTIKGGT